MASVLPRLARRGHLIALDRRTVRSMDADGHLHISATPISKANVCGYLGCEIPGWQGLGLNRDSVYNLYRDPEELAAAAESFNGKQLMFGHVPVDAADHAPDDWIGTVSGVEWKPPYLMARLDIVAQRGIDAVQSGEREELSCGYDYVPVMEAGHTPDGDRYDGRMTKIRGNHVAIVPEGRAGRDVRALDAGRRRLKDVLMPTRQTPEARKTIARNALATSGLRIALAGLARGRLAQDAKLDLGPALQGITAANMRTKARTVARLVVDASRGKLAQDADMPAEQVQAVVEEVADLIKAESDDIAAAVADPDPAAAPGSEGQDGPDMAALMSFLDGKISDEDMAKVKEMCGGEKDDAEDRRRRGVPAAPSGQDGEKPTVTQAAMDAAMARTRREAAEDGAKQAREHFAALREAEGFVRRVAPTVGEIGIACDSAEAVYRAALDVMDVKHDGRHPDALRDLVEVHGQAAAAKRDQHTLGQDAAPDVKGPSYGTDQFPHAKRLK